MGRFVRFQTFQFYGYRIYIDPDDDETWRFVHNGEAVAETHKTLPCGKCSKPRTPEGHDACLGILPGGVMNACCGHGVEEMTYVQFENGECVRGKQAQFIIEKLKESRGE